MDLSGDQDALENQEPQTTEGTTPTDSSLSCYWGML